MWYFEEIRTKTSSVTEHTDHEDLGRGVQRIKIKDEDGRPQWLWSELDFSRRETPFYDITFGGHGRSGGNIEL